MHSHQMNAASKPLNQGVRQLQPNLQKAWPRGITVTTVYVQLLNEGTTVYWPTLARELVDGTFELLKPEGYDPEDELWEGRDIGSTKSTNW